MAVCAVRSTAAGVKDLNGDGDTVDHRLRFFAPSVTNTRRYGRHHAR